MRTISIFFLCLIVSGCADKITRKLRRADKLIKQAEALGAKVNQDTVFIDRTIITPARVTTVELPGLSTIRDTVIYKYQDRIKIEWRVRNNTLFERIECPPDTLRINVPVTVTRTISAPPCPHTWRTIAFILSGILLVLMLIAFLTGRLK